MTESWTELSLSATDSSWSAGSAGESRTIHDIRGIDEFVEAFKMSELIRSPGEVGSWSWFLTAEGWPRVSELMECLALTARPLAYLELLNVTSVEVQWRERGRRQGARKILPVESDLFAENFVESVRNSYPASFSDPRIGTIDLMGSGVWLDAAGARHKVEQLVEVFAVSIPEAVGVELQVHHDVWSAYSFDGTPHPDVHEKNAPRLAEAIGEVEKVLHVEAEPGEPTSFGVSDRYGIGIQGRRRSLTEWVQI